MRRRRQKQLEQAQAQAQAQARAQQMEQARQMEQRRQQQIDAAVSPPPLHQSLQQYSPEQQHPAVRSAVHGARDEAVALTSPAKGKRQLAALRPLGPPSKHNSPATQVTQTPQPQQQGTPFSPYSPQPMSAGAAAYYSSNGPDVARFSPAAMEATPGGQGPAWTAGGMDMRLRHEYQHMLMQGGMEGGGMAPGGDSTSVQVNGSRMGHGELRSVFLIVRPCPLRVC